MTYRTIWLLHHVLGIMNALAALGALSAENYVAAAISAACMLFLASWRVMPSGGSKQ